MTAMWPFTRTERRDFTQITSDRALNAAIGNTALADATSTAAAAIAMGIYGRTFAAAEVAPSVERTGLTAHVLNQIGQSLISAGESVWLIDVVGGMVKPAPRVLMDDRRARAGPSRLAI